MKKIIVLFVLVSFTLAPIMAQARRQNTSTVIRGQSLNGSTGLYTVSTGRIGWEDSKDLALDLGYRAIINNAGTVHIPSVTMSLFKMIELSAAYDIQPDLSASYSNDDLLFGLKIQLPTRNTAIALGASIQLIDFSDTGSRNRYQPYIAITYPGTFFSMSAETTMVIGKTFYSERENNSDIDFGMGFDLVLLPDIFNGIIHLIIDFANFAYSSDPWPRGILHRGVFNAGFRFDLSRMPVFSKYKVILDAAFNDILDDGSRSFTVGVVFGLPLM